MQQHLVFSRLVWIAMVWGVALAFLGVVRQPAQAQEAEGPLRIFGYYQNAFEVYTASEITRNSNTFLTQQLNLIAQKDLAPKFRSFVNFEFLNTFEGSLGWGSASLKEAWVRYDHSTRFKLKIGLHIPTFNHLNDIKISTPLLPYIVRPIVYETSLQDVMNIEEFVPERAFFQAYGTFRKDELAFNYAVYLGNSPNVNNDRFLGQTGVDTTKALLVGGRMGIQWDRLASSLSELRFGISSTYDRVNTFIGVAELLRDGIGATEVARDAFEELPRWRLGADFGLYWNKLYVHAEFITVFHDQRSVQLDVDRAFAYATLGVVFSDRWDAYVTGWHGFELGRIRDRIRSPLFDLREKAILNVYSVGTKYAISPRLVVKAQVATPVRDYDVDLSAQIEQDGLDERVREKTSFAIIGLALSVFF